MIRPTKVIRGKVNAAVIHEYPELENIEITPTVEDQVYKSDMYGFDEVKVKGVQAYIDEDIKPEYIKEGVDVLGVVGNVVELEGEEKTIVPSTTQQVIEPSEGKNAITKLTVEAVDNTIDEDIKPENIVEGVEILGVVGNYKGIDTSDATVTTEDVLSGKIVYINNEKQIGTMPNNGELNFEPSDEEQTIPTGYTSGGSVLPADITKLDEYDKCLTIINSIEDMSEYSDTTATPEDIREGKTAYSNGERITGTYKPPVLPKITDGRYLFYDNIRLDSLYEILEMCDGLTDMSMMFYGSTNLTEIDLSNIDTSEVIKMSSTFQGCSNLTSVDMTNCDLGKVQGIASLFKGNTKLTNIGTFKNLGKGYVTTTMYDTNCALNLVETKISHDNLVDIIDNGLYDLYVTFNIPRDVVIFHRKQKIMLSQSLLDSLTEEEKNRAIYKGWIPTTS